jgi:hypothetical protein
MKTIGLVSFDGPETRADRRELSHGNRLRLQMLAAAAFTGCTVSLTTSALLQADGAALLGLVLICAGATLMVAVCLVADRHD